jgi:hypothetical protein
VLAICAAWDTTAKGLSCEALPDDCYDECIEMTRFDYPNRRRWEFSLETSGH